MRITQQNLTLKSTYDHQQESVRKQEVLPTLAKPDQQDVKVEVRLQSRDALGVSLSRRDLQKQRSRTGCKINLQYLFRPIRPSRRKNRRKNR